MLAWILSKLFPVRPLRLHPIEDMKEILDYQYRSTRVGNEPTGAIVGARVVGVTEGEYVCPKRSFGKRIATYKKPVSGAIQ